MLDDKNAIQFFQQYEKENKVNKVRIYTDFGNIDILLFEETKYHRANFIFYACFLFWFATINHSGMRIAAPAYLYALCLLNVVNEKNLIHRKQIR